MPGPGDRSDEGRGFKVEDKRRFETDGTARPEAPAEAAPSAPAGESRPKQLPPLDFGTFLLSLGTSALIHLGEAPEAGETEGQRNLPLAQQSIDLLALLQEKTKGNLTADEEALLRELLYDLRVKFVAARGSGRTAGRTGPNG